LYKIKTLDELSIAIDSNQILAVDLETDGFYGPICVAQLYQQHWDEVVLVHKPNPLHLATILGDTHIVGHNIHYDISTIQAQTGTAWQPKQFDDTFFAARLHYFAKDSFSLDNVLYYVLGYDPYEQFGLDKKELQKSDWTGLLTEDQMNYAALDVLHMFEVIDIVGDKFEDFSYKLDIAFTTHCLNFQCNGLAVDQEKLQAQFQRNTATLKEMAMPININSWKQVRPYIGEDESDALALSRFTLEGNERAANVNKARKLTKENSFLKKFDTQDGRIYGKFLPSARSGRCTSKDQNLQQLPRKTKGVFGVTEDSGRTLVYADFAQLELRGACVITNESRMEALFRSGEDLHAYTAKMLFGEDYTKEQRQIAKTCNFNLLYGGGHNMLGSILVQTAGLLLPEHELRHTKRKWQKLWPTLVAWQGRGINAWKNGVVWQTPLGRKYKGKMMTDQLNIQVQGFGAEVAKLATHYMMPNINILNESSKHEPARVVNFIHDSWIIECDNDPAVYKQVAIILAEAMQEAWTEACKSVVIKDLPMPVDVFVGRNWGDIEAGKFDYEYKVS